MRIAYVARHDQPHSNDDEGAITHALLALGHDVQRLRESIASRAHRLGADLLLCHHLRDVRALDKVRCPVVFWCFDRVANWPGMEPRQEERQRWADEITARADLGFMTDGDWQALRPGKLRWLPQGFDERLATVRVPRRQWGHRVVFAGSGRGYGREAWVERMRRRWQEEFRHVSSGYHGEDLALLVAHAETMVAPPWPVTMRYWSNRAYLLMGLGAYLVHPNTLTGYEPGRHYVAYGGDRWDAAVDAALRMTRGERDAMAAEAVRRTMEAHTYRERVRCLIETVEREVFDGRRANQRSALLETPAAGGPQGGTPPRHLPVPAGPLAEDRGEAQDTP